MSKASLVFVNLREVRKNSPKIRGPIGKCSLNNSIY